ncbi:hypothetical protein [Ruminococcus albus]|uniref:Uncharacterized protein n=1 Tax=Ruminococcus albus TaxID=1264 RepID=A0A1I1M5G5_RUMAL|nr:hypothetical protein [Ruminococcus albus]SFC76900.1 hypothetical protein SAMN02910406_02351 [Ruminococcus albus]
MDFYDVTKNPYIVLKDVGSYQCLAGLLGETLDHKWEENTCADLKSTFFKFCRHCRSTLKITDIRDLSEAFLMYISKFSDKDHSV